MKKMLIVLSTILVLTGSLTACTKKAPDPDPEPKIYDTTTLSFDEDTTIKLNNPMQGFYWPLYVEEVKKELGEVKRRGLSLLALSFSLNGFQSKELSEKKLNQLRDALELCRQQKVDIIFRAAYGFEEEFNTREPKNFSIVLRHIEQISEVLAPYSDIILCVQAGMIGPWGEWHSSSMLRGKSAEEIINMRYAVVNAWIVGLPDSNVIIQVRRPIYLRQMVEKGAPMERLGFHNDALLSEQSDMDTYLGSKTARQDELTWCYENLWFVHNGGEMNQKSKFSEPENAIKEFKELRLTYLNSDYLMSILNSWKKKKYNDEVAYDYIHNHLGSRLFVSDVTAPLGFYPDKPLTIQLLIENSGFSTSHPSLKFWLVFNTNGVLSYQPLEYELSQGDYSLSFFIETKLPDLSQAKELSVGIIAGFGDTDNLRPFTFANQTDLYKDGVLFFLDYYHNGEEWLLKDANN